MKKKLRKIIRSFKQRTIKMVIFFHSSYFYCRLHKAKIVVFDIDNTICDTWPLFLKKELLNEERWQLARPFPKIINLVLNYQAEGYKIVFLTARPWTAKKITLKWLKEHNLPSDHVYISLTALNKIHYLKKLQQNFDYYDDLSYNAEHGEVKYYHEVIDFIKTKPNIHHYDFLKLLSLQSEDSK